MKASTLKTEMTATTRSGSDVRAETSVDTKLKLKLRRLRLQQLIGENLFPVWIRKKENQMAVHFEIPLFILSFHKKATKNSRPSIYKKNLLWILSQL